jgi:tetratricopeptide (TPR) repeat protein
MCNDILRRDNNNPDALYAKAISYYYQDMQDKANSFFQRALRADPDHRKSRLAMKKSKKLLAMKEEGNMAFRQGRMEEAHHLYSEALTVDPLNTLTNAKLHCNRALVGSKVNHSLCTEREREHVISSFHFFLSTVYLSLSHTSLLHSPTPSLLLPPFSLRPPSLLPPSSLSR